MPDVFLVKYMFLEFNDIKKKEVLYIILKYYIDK